MRQLEDEELSEMWRAGEGGRVEFKQEISNSAVEKAGEAVCAFANDLADHRDVGVILFGVRDDGSFTDIDIAEEALNRLAQLQSNGNIVPPPVLSVDRRTLDGHAVAVITVAPSNSPPVRWKGNIWLRIGATNQRASGEQERTLNEKRRHRDRPFDIEPIPGSALADINLGSFRDEYLPLLISVEAREANQRTIKQQLAAAKMVDSSDDPVPTILGHLVLGRRTRDFVPGAYIQFLRLGGSNLNDPVIDEALIDGTISDILRGIDEKLKAHIATSVDLVSAERETRHASYPLVALQQLIRNAVMHRRYEGTNAPVRVTWFADRIEIISPGGPFGQVTAANFGQPGITDYRNPNLAEAMKTQGWVQRFGVGIATAQQELVKNGLPEAVFRVEDTTILAVLSGKRA